MLLYGSFTAITILLGLVVGKKGKIADRIALTGIFLLLSMFSLLRVNIGNDYGRYNQIFHELRHDGYVITEPLFNRVVEWIMKQPLWYDHAYEVVFGVFGVVTVALTVKILYDYSDHFGITFFLYMTLGLYFQSFSTVRYYLALPICLYAVRFLCVEPKIQLVSCVPSKAKKRKWKEWLSANGQSYALFLLIILFASGFHKSALIVIPMYLVARLPWDEWKHKKLVIAIFLLLCVQFLVFQNFYKEIMLRIYWSYEEEEGLTQATISYANIARALITFVWSLLVYPKVIRGNKRNRFWFTCNVFALALYTFGYYVPIVSRIGYFLNMSQLFLIPTCIRATGSVVRKRWATAAVVVAGVMFFMAFLKVASGSLAILPYQTWVFTELEPVRMPVYTQLGIE